MFQRVQHILQHCLEVLERDRFRIDACAQQHFSGFRVQGKTGPGGVETGQVGGEQPDQQRFSLRGNRA